MVHKGDAVFLAVLAALGTAIIVIAFAIPNASDVYFACWERGIQEGLSDRDIFVWRRGCSASRREFLRLSWDPFWTLMLVGVGTGLASHAAAAWAARRSSDGRNY